MPQLAAVARIDGPDVVGRGDVEHAVHLKNGALDARRAADLLRALTADDDRRTAATATAPTEAPSAGAGTGGEPAHPAEREVLDGGLVDLRERAVAAAGHITGVGRP